MPRKTKRSSKSSAKPKKNCCGCRAVQVGGRWLLIVCGPKYTGTLQLASIEDCEAQARLAAEVAYNTCVFQGGTEEYCEGVSDEVYHQVYDECING